MTVRAVRKLMAGGVGAAMALTLAGCSMFRSSAGEERIYVLNPATAGGVTAAVVPGVLLIPRPAAQPGLDTDRIALTRPGNELDFYAGSRWGGALPPVLAALTIQSLAGSFTTVSSADRGVGAGDFELLLTVRHFEAHYESPVSPTVHVALDCLLVSRAPRRVLGNCDADVREDVAQNRMGAIIEAFEKASRAAMAQVREKAVGAASAANIRPVGAVAAPSPNIRPVGGVSAPSPTAPATATVPGVPPPGR